MRTILKNFAPVVLTILLAAPILTTGCAHHARYHDPYYHDYHPVAGEDVYYGRWEAETHHDHVDLNRRGPDEQKQYWDWRHNQH
jgi:hypothetical protein